VKPSSNELINESPSIGHPQTAWQFAWLNLRPLGRSDSGEGLFSMFSGEADAGIRVFLDDELIIDDWKIAARFAIATRFRGGPNLSVTGGI
jgi:hypothetical protein